MLQNYDEEARCTTCGFVLWDNPVQPLKKNETGAPNAYRHHGHSDAAKHPLQTTRFSYCYGAWLKPTTCIWLLCESYSALTSPYCVNHRTAYFDCFDVEAPIWSEMALPNKIATIYVQWERTPNVRKDNRRLYKERRYTAALSGIWMPETIPDIQNNRRERRRLRKAIESALDMPLAYFSEVLKTTEYFDPKSGPNVPMRGRQNNRIFNIS